MKPRAGQGSCRSCRVIAPASRRCAGSPARALFAPWDASEQRVVEGTCFESVIESGHDSAPANPFPQPMVHRTLTPAQKSAPPIGADPTGQRRDTPPPAGTPESSRVSGVALCQYPLILEQTKDLTSPTTTPQVTPTKVHLYRPRSDLPQPTKDSLTPSLCARSMRVAVPLFDCC